MSGQQRFLRDEFHRGRCLTEAEVDRGRLLISNVPLLGRVSQNGRRYSTQAMQDAVELYRDVQVYVDHPRESEMRDRGGTRSVRDLAGRVRNPRRSGDQVRGDIELLDREPTKSLFLSLATQMPEAAGMSHRAEGSVRVDDSGVQHVESLSKVGGVELVTEPATVRGLQEQIEAREDRHEEVIQAFTEQGVPEETVREFPKMVEAIATHADDIQEAVREQVEARQQYQEEEERSARTTELGGGGWRRGGGTRSRSTERDPDDWLRPDGKRRNGDGPPELSDDDMRELFGW